MAPLPGMETIAARLASFDTTLKVPKRRGSSVKGRTISWPHQRPSPNELAEAGLYYKPTASSPDNTTCFLCQSQIADWEEDDDPVVEHVNLCGGCGWAVIKSVGRQGDDLSTMEDPTSERLLEARRSTFESRWPHENKRGWVCKTDKMAAAGWHFAPTPESEDFVSCAYCDLSLDGWEPKDSPFDEHYRRSPGCVFFSFAGTTAPKPARGKKGRASKASRASTQSNAAKKTKATKQVTPSPSPQSSDAENRPPSSRPPSTRPPLSPLSAKRESGGGIQLAPGTPTQIPLSPNKIGGLRSEIPWTAVDVEMVFAPSPDKENCNMFAGASNTELTSPEKAMSVEEWIKSQASAAEESLKAESERVVGIFEREGGRALRVLEGADVMEMT